MTIQETGRLEALTSAAALGMWADDVVIALSRRLRMAPLDVHQKRLLSDAASVLRKASERTASPLLPINSARALAATDTALAAIANVAPDKEPSQFGELMADLAEAVDDAAASEKLDDARLKVAMTLFGVFGELQLADTASVLATRKDSGSWTATPATLSSL